MVRETRHLWVGNLPARFPEDRIKEHFKRFGRVQSVKILGHNKDDGDGGGEAATVAFMDIKSANKAHSVEHKIEDRLLKTDYYDPSSFNVPGSIPDSNNCDPRTTNSPQVRTPEDCGPGPGGGLLNDFNENSRSSHNNNSSEGRSGGGARDFRGSTGGSNQGARSFDSDTFSSRQNSSRSSRTYRGGQSSFDRNGPSSHYGGSSGRQGSSALNSSSWKSEAPLSPKPGSTSGLNPGGLGSNTADILSSSVKSSSLYLNNDDRRNAASPVSTSSSTSSKRLNGHASSMRPTDRDSRLRNSKLSSVSSVNSSSASHTRQSRRRSRSSESGSDSSGSESGSGSRSSSSSSSASSSSDNSRSTSNSLKLNQRKTTRNVLTSSASGVGSSVIAGSGTGSSAGSSVAGLNNSVGSSVGSGLGSGLSSSSHGSGRKPLMSSSSGASQVARPVAFDDKTNCAICIRNLPMRGNGPSDLSLQDFLLHEYNNVCNVRSVRIGHSGRHGRYAVIYLATMTDVDKALNEPRLITKTYHNAEVDVMLAGEEIVEDKRLYYRPSDAELEEYHPKATRTLFVGGLSRDIASSIVQEKFERFGEILEIDIKKIPVNPNSVDPLKSKSCYANVQFTDLSSVCRGIRECDGDSLGNNSSNKITLGFARAAPTKCVWCCGVTDSVKEKDIAHEFGRYGKIQDILILRSRGQALVWFDQTIKAQRAVTEMRGRYLKGSKLQADYASHECRAAFFEQCKNSGMDMKERSKPWEIHQPHLTAANENSNSPDSIYSREKYDRRSERSCDSPRTPHHRLHYGHRGSGLTASNVASGARSPSPGSGGGPAGANAGRYKPSTQAISPPRDSFSDSGEGKHSYVGDLRDSLNRSKETRNNRYHRNYTSSKETSLKDPRSRRGQYTNDLRGLVSPNSSGDEKDNYRLSKAKGGADSGLSEDHGSTGSSGSTGGGSGSHLATSNYRNKHLTNSVTGSGLKNSSTDKVRRSSTDSARSSVTGGIHLHDDLDLRISPHNFKPSAGSVAGADDVSDGSRPGTPLCDERPENLSGGVEPQKSSNIPVRLERLSGHGRSTEPMSLPLPKFATQMLANQIQSANSASSAYLTVATSKKDPRLKSPSTGVSSHSSLSVSTCLKSPPPSLKSPGLTSNSSRIIPEHNSSSLGSDAGGILETSSSRKSSITNSSSVDSSGKPHDPRLGHLNKSKHVSASMQPSASIPVVNNKMTTGSLEIEDISDSDREDNDGPEQQGIASVREPHDGQPETDMATGSTQPEVTDLAAAEEKVVQTPVQDPATMTLEERLKALDEKYQKWSGNSGAKNTPTPVTPGGQGQAVKDPVLPNLNITNANTNVSTPVHNHTLVSDGGSGISSGLNSAPSTATLTGSGTASTGSTGCSTPASNKFSFDLKPMTQPSPIVQQLLARKSVFDEDTKRLENLNSVPETPEAQKGVLGAGSGSEKPKDQNENKQQNIPSVNDQVMTVGSVNFGSTSYNSIPTLSEQQQSGPKDSSSIGTNPGSSVVRSMSAQDQKQPSTPVRPMLNKLNSVQNDHTTALNAKSPSSNPTGATATATSAVSIKTVPTSNPGAGGIHPTRNPTSTTSSALVPSTPPIIGQVRPVAKPGLNPGILTTSSVTMPIKPLVDNKIRPLQVSTKPSATVTPTFKTSSTTSHQAQSGLRRNSTLTTTTASTKSLCTTTTNTSSMLAKASVEKLEASSTTSSPKITNNSESECGNDQRNSPESSTHPEVVSSSGVSPKSGVELLDESVSSTTKELNLDPFKSSKNNSSSEKALKNNKVDVDPFGALIKDTTFAGKKTETNTLVKKVELDGQPANKVIKSEININAVSNKKHGSDSKGDRSKERSSHNSSSKTEGSRNKLNSSSHKSDVKSKMKELKDKEFKELFAATDTIPNHVKQSSSSTKHESKEGHGKSSSHRKPSEDHSGTSKSKSSDSKKGEHGSHSSSHHGSHHHGHGSHHGSSHSGSHSSSSHHGDKSTHHKSSSSNKDTNKRRLSDADHPPEMGPKNKVPKVTENANIDTTKIKKEPGLATSSEMKMGRIPKIKKPEGGSQTASSEATGSSKKSSLHSTSGSSSNKSSNKDDSHSSKKHLSSSSSSNRDKLKEKDKKSSFNKKRPHHSDDETSEKSSKKKHRHSDSKDKKRSSESKDRDGLKKSEKSSAEKDRRKSTSSQASNTSTANASSSKSDSKKEKHAKKLEKLAKQISGNSDKSSASEFSEEDENEPKKFSIFDDPIIDMDNPVYFSMYDKVKARRSCVAKREENARRQQEALLAKFSKLKAERDKKKEPGHSDSEDDEMDNDGMSSDQVSGSTERKIGNKKKHMISSSSDEAESDKDLNQESGENSGKMQQLKKLKAELKASHHANKPTKKAISDTSSSDSDNDSSNDEQKIRKSQQKLKKASSNSSKPSLAKKSSKPSRSSLLDSSDEDDDPPPPEKPAQASRTNPESNASNPTSIKKSSSSTKSNISSSTASSISNKNRPSTDMVIKSEGSGSKPSSGGGSSAPTRKVVPTKSATAKVKTEVSSSDSSSDSEPCNKAAATAVLVQNKKKQSASTSASTASNPTSVASKTSTSATSSVAASVVAAATTPSEALVKTDKLSTSATAITASSQPQRRDTVDSSTDSSDSSSNSDDDSQSDVKTTSHSQPPIQPREQPPALTSTSSTSAVASTKPKRKSSSEESSSNNEKSGQKSENMPDVEAKKKGSESSSEGKFAASMVASNEASVTAAAAAAAKQKSDREKLDLDKKMSKIFGTSSDDEEVSFKNKVDLHLKVNESDSDKASNSSSPRLKSKKVRTKKERNSSGRSSCGSRRETAESLFDQLTVIEPPGEAPKPAATSPLTATASLPAIKTEPRDYSAFAEGIKDMNLSSSAPSSNNANSSSAPVSAPTIPSIKEEMIGPLDKQLEEESKSREQSELDKSIASITEDVVKTVIKTECNDPIIPTEDIEMKSVNLSGSVNLQSSVNQSVQSPSPVKRSVISQEETDQAVTALLGESFENSFEEKQNQNSVVNAQQNSQPSAMTSVDSVSAVGLEPGPMQTAMDTDEAAKAVAGLESEMAATDTSANVEVTPIETPQPQPPTPAEPIVPSLPVPEASKEKAVTAPVIEPTTPIQTPVIRAETTPPSVLATTVVSTPPTRGRGSRGGRGGRAAGSRKTEVQPAEPPVARRASSRGRSATGSESESSDKAPEVVAQPVTSVRGRGTGSRGGRGGRGSAAVDTPSKASTLPSSNANSRRRSSETSTDSNKQQPLTSSGVSSNPAPATVATKTSVFDWPDMDDETEMMTSPTLKEEKAKRGQQLQLQQQQQQQNVLHVDTSNLETTPQPSVVQPQLKSSPRVASPRVASPKVASPKVEPKATVSTPPMQVISGVTSRQRRSTGSNRSSKDQLETTPVVPAPAPAASNNDLEVKQETEEKINAILEHAKKQQEIEKHHHNQQMGLLREAAVVQQNQGPPQQQPSATPPALSVFPANPAQMMTALQQAAVTGQPPAQATPTPTTRPPTAVTVTVQQPQQPQTRPPPPHQTPSGPQLVQPPLANSPGLSVVQLPTQPLPASEIARNVTCNAKQVLLEPKAAPSSPRPRTMSSPRTGSSISLPTQPVPLSATQLTSVANAIVARTMTSVNPMMPMLPNQPLPPPQCQPKLPQHPLPPTSATSISVVPTKTEAATPPPPPVQQPQPTVVSAPQPAQQTQPTTAPMPPKKTAVTMAVNPKKRVIAQQLEQDQTIKMETSIATPPAAEQSPQPALQIMIKKEMPTPASPSVQPQQHMKPRDAFGRGAHLKEEKKQQPTISLAAQEQQLALIREQEISIFFQALIKQGQTEHMALELARKMAQERYTAAFTLAMQQAQASVEQELRSASVSGPTGNAGGQVNPPAAHQSQSNSPQSAVVHLPTQAHAHSRISTSYIGPYSKAIIEDPYSQHDQRHVIMSLNPPASPEPEMALSQPLNLDPMFPMVWKGYLGLKNEFASVEFRYVSGCKDLANTSLPHDPNSLATLRIGQRMRLEPTHLSGVRTKMQQAAEHCVLLALPCGTDPHDMALQSRNLRSHFITYLQLKGAAGIVNVLGDPAHAHGGPGGDQGGYVVHVFPSCDFANETMTSIAPDLLAKVAEMEHMVIIIATVLDKTQNATE